MVKLSDFKYVLPEKMVAQHPVDRRDSSRLMVLNRKTQDVENKIFRNVIDYLNEGDCLVLNETKVFPARIMGTKDKTDAKVEIFLLRELEKNLWEVLVKPARKVRIGNKLHIPRGINCDVIDNTVSGGRVLRFDSNGDFYKVIDEIGECPLPPYIKRKPDLKDKERYQTVYAKNRGAVAAPTAGLHFTKDLLERIRKKKIKIVYVTVHIGLGTFRPVQVEDLARHRMDSEFFEVPWDTVQTVNETMKNGKKIFAVGTSVVRALESVVDANGLSKPMKGWTDKFIYPPYEFKIVDGVITNFHLPYSTLLMLVCAFAGREYIYKAYKQAIKEKYRFYSYGDAMLIL